MPRKAIIRGKSARKMPHPVTEQWCVYLVRCRDRALYTGIATDVPRRFAEHVREGGRGSKYLRGKGPLELVFVRAIGPKNLALRVESRLKKLRKTQKEALVDQQLLIDGLIERARTGQS